MLFGLEIVLTLTVIRLQLKLRVHVARPSGLGNFREFTIRRTAGLEECHMARCITICAERQKQ